MGILKIIGKFIAGSNERALSANSIGYWEVNGEATKKSNERGSGTTNSNHRALVNGHYVKNGYDGLTGEWGVKY